MQHQQNTTIAKSLEKRRKSLGLTQKQLADMCGLQQEHISWFEIGRRRPTFEQILVLARVLRVSIQWFLTGANHAGCELRDSAVELQAAGIVDLWVPESRVPGAFRPIEQVVAVVLQEKQPDSRIIEAVPAVLAWNTWRIELLEVYAKIGGNHVLPRLAWLADIALTIHRSTGFPGGCSTASTLEQLLERAHPAQESDGLGRPATKPLRSAVWKRWNINYGATINAFRNRAKRLDEMKSKSADRWNTETENESAT